jgi:hypothetical protein
MFGVVIYDQKGTLQFAPYLTIIIYAPSKGQVSFDHSFIVKAIVIMIVMTVASAIKL